MATGARSGLLELNRTYPLDGEVSSQLRSFNAVAESFWGTLKRELGRGWWPTRAEARRAVFHYITIFYNRQRRHSALGYLTPQEAIDRYSHRQTLVA